MIPDFGYAGVPVFVLKERTEARFFHYFYCRRIKESARLCVDCLGFEQRRRRGE